MADTVIVLLFLMRQVWIVVTLGGLPGRAPLSSLLFGILLPFLIQNGPISLVIFPHHTHPTVRWNPSVAAWEADRAAIGGTAHMRYDYDAGRWIPFDARRAPAGVPDVPRDG